MCFPNAGRLVKCTARIWENLGWLPQDLCLGRKLHSALDVCNLDCNLLIRLFINQLLFAQYIPCLTSHFNILPKRTSFPSPISARTIPSSASQHCYRQPWGPTFCSHKECFLQAGELAKFVCQAFTTAVTWITLKRVPLQVTKSLQTRSRQTALQELSL